MKSGQVDRAIKQNGSIHISSSTTKVNSSKEPFYLLPSFLQVHSVRNGGRRTITACSLSVTRVCAYTPVEIVGAQESDTYRRRAHVTIAIKTVGSTLLVAVLPNAIRSHPQVKPSS